MNTHKNTTIIIATHKDYIMPNSKTYMPLWVGAEKSKTYKGQYQGDNTGDNISVDNSNFNELTGLYWLWKNIHSDYKGLAHYRRYIGEIGGGNSLNDIIESDTIEAYLQNYDVIVPKPKKFYLINSYNHYVNSIKGMQDTHKKDLEMLRDAVSSVSPDYLLALDEVYHSNKVHMLNMFIMKQKDFDDYCNWLFRVLFEMEKHVERYRVLGAMGEFLLDTYLIANKMSFKEMPLIELEKVPFFKRVLNRVKKMLLS